MERITDAERAAALDQLNATRERLKGAVAGVSETQARYKTAPERWSILELVEHMATSDVGLLEMVEQALEGPAQPELMAEARARDRRFFGEFKPVPRGVNQAPEALKPRSRYATLGEATRAFEESRARVIAYVQETDASLRDHFHAHGVFGPMDCFQWLVACARHAESHTRQIEDIKADAGYPSGAEAG